MKINVVALLDLKSEKVINQHLLNLSKITKNDRALRFRPHITLRNTFTVKNFDSFLLKLEKYCYNTGTFSLKVSTTSITLWNAIYLDPEVNDRLQNLHESLMNLSQPHFQFSKYKEKLANFKSARERENINLYSMAHAFDLYSPHITLAGGRIDPMYIDKAREYLQKIDLPIEIQITNIGVYDLTSDSTPKLICEMPLRDFQE